MAFKTKVTIDDKPLRKLLKQLKGKTGAIDKMLKQWGIIYLAEQRRRFQKFSRGSGDWQPLSDEYAEQKGSTIILILTGVLFNALSPGAPGNVFKRTKNGLIVGAVGEGQTSKGFTIAALAEAHHEGSGNLPARPIIEAPGRDTVKRFLVVARKAVLAAAKV